jgi:GNAT superfamily N-acetyltransferase
MIARTTADRNNGAAYWNAVVDRGDVKGLASLLDPYTDNAEMRAWIDPAFRRRGYGALAVRMVLEFAFRNLQLRRVTAVIPTGDDAATRTLAKFGFVPADDSPVSTTLTPNEPMRYAVTRSEWIAHRDRPAIAALHPDLRAILDAELAAGNEVVESGGGWPDDDSVFIRLRDPFRTTPFPLPDGVVYTEPKDPHWWKADYSSRSPRHILAC